jgi:hypothetical protein
VAGDRLAFLGADAQSQESINFRNSASVATRLAGPQRQREFSDNEAMSENHPGMEQADERLVACAR